MKRHALKIQQEYLDELKAGNKKAEIRLNDRDYQKHDILEFTDYSEIGNVKQIQFRIRHVHSGLGMERNYVCLSLEPINND